MKPIKSENFLFFPRQAISLSGMEKAVGDLISVEKAGPFYFKEPYFLWENIQEQEIIVISYGEWALSRIGYLAEVEPNLLLFSEGSDFCFSIEVNDLTGQTIASITFRTNRYSSRWEGFASSIPLGQSAAKEFQTLLAREPLSLALYEVRVRGLGKIGWNGNSFFGQKIFQRPKIKPPKFR